jgi:hypothetical protein
VGLKGGARGGRALARGEGASRGHGPSYAQKVCTSTVAISLFNTIAGR